MLGLSHCFFICFWRITFFCMAILQITQVVSALQSTWAAGFNSRGLLCFTREIAPGDYNVRDSCILNSFLSLHSLLCFLQSNRSNSAKQAMVSVPINHHWSDQHRSHECRHSLHYCSNQSLKMDTPAVNKAKYNLTGIIYNTQYPRKIISYSCSPENILANNQK